VTVVFRNKGTIIAKYDCHVIWGDYDEQAP